MPEHSLDWKITDDERHIWFNPTFVLERGERLIGWWSSGQSARKGGRGGA